MPRYAPQRRATTDTSLTRAFYVFVLVSTVLGAAHHVDHIVRGNHVGWPITSHGNPFTYSLAIYPLLAMGLYLTLTERVEARYWVGFFALSAGLLAYVHGEAHRRGYFDVPRECSLADALAVDKSTASVTIRRGAARVVGQFLADRH